MKKIIVGVLLFCSMLLASSISGRTVSSVVSSKIALDLSGTYSGQGYRDLTLSGKLTGTVVDTFSEKNAKNCVTVQGELKGILCGSFLDTSASSSSEWFWIDVYDTVSIKGFFTQVLMHPDSSTDSVAHRSYIQKGATLQGSVLFLDKHIVNRGSLPMVKLQNQYQLVKEVAGSVDGDVDMLISGLLEYPSQGVVQVLGTVKGDYNALLTHEKYSQWDSEDSIDMMLSTSLHVNAVLVDTEKGDTIGTLNDNLFFSIHIYDLFLPEEVTKHTELELSGKKIYGTVRKANDMAKIYSGTMSGVSMTLVVDTLFSPYVLDSVSWKDSATTMWKQSELDSMFHPQREWKKLALPIGGELLVPRSVRLNASELESPFSSFQIAQSFTLDHNTVTEPNYVVAVPVTEGEQFTLLSGRGGRHFEPPFQRVEVDGIAYQLYNVSSSEAVLSLVTKIAVVAVSDEACLHESPLSVRATGKTLQLRTISSDAVQITLHNVQGRIVQQFHSSDIQNGASFVVDSHLASGLYMLRVQQGEQQLQRCLYLP